MIDLENYKRAIQWLERGVTELALEPNNESVRDSVLLSFEVTYNVSESILRKALSEVATSLNTAKLSSRELMKELNAFFDRLEQRLVLVA